MNCSKWKDVSLNEVSELISRGITPSYIEQDGVIVINQKCIRDNRLNLDLARLTNPIKRKIPEQKKLKLYDVLVNSTGVGTLGRVAQVKELNGDMTVDSHVTIVRANEKINPRFLGYNLFMQQKNIEHLAEGSTGQTELSRTRFGEAIKIKLPSIKEQEKIVSILSTIEGQIDLNNNMNKTLVEMAQGLFKRWFVDFEFPNEDGEPYKSSGGEMVESELELIPKDWSLASIEDVAIINPRETIKKGEKKVFVEMANLPCNSARVTQTDIKEFSGGTKFRNGDTLLARITPCLENGKTAIVDFLNEDEVAFGSTEYIIMRPKYLNTYYLYCLARYEEFRNNVIKNMNGSSGRQRVDAKFIKEYKIVIPTKELLDRFNQYCKSLFVQMKENDDESTAMTEIRNSLLPKLMSGEIRVEEIEANL